MRANLKQARKDKGMTQQRMADYLGISARYYKSIESGAQIGHVEMWDKMEDLFNIHQRTLREIFADNHHGKEDNPKKHLASQQS